MIDLFKIMRLMGYPVSQAKREYSTIQKQNDLKVWQTQKRWELIKYHFDNNPYYRLRVGEIPQEWEDLPVLKKSDLQGDFLSKVPPVFREKDLYISNTSGSSGQPFFFAKDKLTHVLIWLNVEAHYRNAGISINDKQARFYGIPLNKKSLIRERIKDVFANRYRFLVFNLEEKILHQWICKFRKTPFKFIYGYTNSLVVFAKYLIQLDIVLKDVCPTLKICIVTSELCVDEDQVLLEKAFGIKIFNEYGASELSVIGFKKGEYWVVSDEVVYLEVLDENDQPVEEGTVGKLVCTLLHNRATPIIRYEIGDLASISEKNGRTYITHLAGRENELAELPSGRKVPGFTFYYVVRSILEQSDFMKEYRIVQLSKSLFEIQVVSEREVSNDVELIIQRSFDKYLESGLQVQLKTVESIDRSGNGKFKHFISMV
ncbi:MAG: phenylacetate--CoA ligase family protein [Marinilabiliaceae bacterium]|nr:phenylacetate--CoA ligase family protein [Marinilabiliaceae bacterium]